MYGHRGQSTHRFVWILDENPPEATELDKELWRRYIDLRADMETALQGLGMIRNWLAAKLVEINNERDETTAVFGWEMENAISHLEVTGNQLRELAGKHLASKR